MSDQTTTFVILVICLMRIPSTSLTLLFRNIEVKESASANETMDLVLKWREHYLLVCEFVASLNDFIGAPFFIFMTYTFNSFVCYSFDVLYNYFSTYEQPSVESYNCTYIILKNGLCIICLAFVSEKIPSKVSRTSQSFPRLN